MALILHLLAADEWRSLPDGHLTYSPASLAAEGFVHCTGDDSTLLDVANARYRDLVGDVLALSLDPSRLRAPVRWEAASPAPPAGSSVTTFPHVYGPLDLAAVVGVRRLLRTSDGRYVGFGASS